MWLVSLAFFVAEIVIIVEVGILLYLILFAERIEIRRIENDEDICKE